MKSEIIRILSDKQNTYRCLHTNTTDTANTTNTTVPEMQTIDQELYQRNQQKPLIVGLIRIYIIRQDTVLKMEID